MPPEVVKVAQVAVAVAEAVADVIALAVNTPPEADGANVADSAKEANRVFPDKAVSGLVGCVPE